MPHRHCYYYILNKLISISSCPEGGSETQVQQEETVFLGVYSSETIINQTITKPQLYHTAASVFRAFRTLQRSRAYPARRNCVIYAMKLFQDHRASCGLIRTQEEIAFLGFPRIDGGLIVV